MEFLRRSYAVLCTVAILHFPLVVVSFQWNSDNWEHPIKEEEEEEEEEKDCNWKYRGLVGSLNIIRIISQLREYYSAGISTCENTTLSLPVKTRIGCSRYTVAKCRPSNIQAKNEERPLANILLSNNASEALLRESAFLADSGPSGVPTLGKNKREGFIEGKKKKHWKKEKEKKLTDDLSASWFSFCDKHRINPRYRRSEIESTF
ncbi:hypothetical protein V1478_004007 [Vespula squamosa]|uniref:Uncharacterized protein n=1 Tax=Vespula squamosa TaxID=30214 RepID=A0ABD2BP05_VESSQ